MAQSTFLAPFRGLFQKDADFQDRWGRRALKYIAWALIGAAAMAIVFYTAPALLPVLVGAAVVKWAAAVGFGLVAGVGMGLVATGLRECIEAPAVEGGKRVSDSVKATLKAGAKVGVGLVLASPLLLAFGLYQGIGLAATAGYMVGAAAAAFMGGFISSSMAATVAGCLGYTPGDGNTSVAGSGAELHPVPTVDSQPSAVAAPVDYCQMDNAMLKAALEAAIVAANHESVHEILMANKQTTKLTMADIRRSLGSVVQRSASGEIGHKVIRGCLLEYENSNGCSYSRECYVAQLREYRFQPRAPAPLTQGKAPAPRIQAKAPGPRIKGKGQAPQTSLSA